MVESTGYQVFYAGNGQYLGDFLCDVDGYYKFFPSRTGGYWEGWVMRAIADEEEELNREWQEIIDNDPALNGVALNTITHPGLPEDFDPEVEIDSGEFNPNSLEVLEITIKGK